MLDFVIYLFAITFLLGVHLSLYFNEHRALKPLTGKRDHQTLEAGNLLLKLAVRFNYQIEVLKSGDDPHGPAWFDPQTRIIGLSERLAHIGSVFANGIVAHEIGHSIIHNVKGFLVLGQIAHGLRIWYPILLLGNFIIVLILGAPIENASGFILLFIIAGSILLLDELVASLLGFIIMNKECNLSLKDCTLLLGFYLRAYLSHVNSILASLLIMLIAHNELFPHTKGFLGIIK